MSPQLLLMIIIAISILVLAIILFILAKNKKTQQEPDYYTFFVMGIIWLFFGIMVSLTSDSGSYNSLFSLGLIFSIVGIINKDKWKQNRKKWANFSDAQKRFKIILITILSFTFLIGLIVYAIAKNQV